MVLNHDIKTSSNINILTKLYIWSIIFDPLLFFILFDKSNTGISGNVSKLFQLFVLIFFILSKLSTNSNLRISHPFNWLSKYYSIYFILTVISGLLGILFGAYSLESDYEKFEGYNAISKLMNGQVFRPIFEYFITLYNFGYFVLLPQYIIKKNSDLDYFFKLFTKFFIATIILGYLDLILIYFFDFPFLPRHLSDGVHPGSRFHGLAGEPRDAFVYLLYAIGVLNLKFLWTKGTLISKKLVILIIFSMFFTQSGSGLIGLLFSSILIFVFRSEKFSYVKIFQGFGIILILFISVYIGAMNSERIELYLSTFPDLWNAIGENQEIPPVFLGQMSNIYPIWHLLHNMSSFNLFPILIGSGLGSASAISNKLGGMNELMNPHSQLVRVIFESGLIGVWLYIQAFLKPVRLLLNNFNGGHNKEVFIIISLFLLGAYFGHRSNTIFIYLGLFVVVFKKLNNRP